MWGKYKFLRKKYKVRRRLKEYPYGEEITNGLLLRMVEDDLRRGRDFILGF